MTDGPNDIPNIRFRQQNLNKSLIAQLDLLNGTDPKDTDFVFLQEPHIDFLHQTRANQHWTVIYPSTHNRSPMRTRSVILVNKSVSKNNWRQIPIESADVTAVELKCARNSISFYNIYNACEHSDTLTLLQTHWQQRTLRSGPAAKDDMVWLGDFNRHHPLWDSPAETRLFTPANIEAANFLIDLTETHGMEMALPAGLPTLQAFRSGNFSRPDNIFCSANLLPFFLECNTKPEERPAKTDHFPIVGTMNIAPERILPAPRFNWRQADWNDFRTKLTHNLAAAGPPRPVTDVEDFQTTFTLISAAIQSAADQTVPKIRPSPFTKRWWTKELTDLRKKKQSLRAKSHRLRAQRLHPVHQEAIEATKVYAESLEQTKKAHWEQWLDDIDADNIWTAHKFANSAPSDGGVARIPTLKRTLNNQTTEVDTNEEKSKILYETFFPRSQNRTHADASTDYPAPVCEFKPITDEQVHRAISRLAPYKAPGPNGISNIVFKKCPDILVPWMGHLFRATFELKFFPNDWLTSKTVVIRKPGRPDYSAPKAYRPIALLDTMSKILSACVAEDLTWITTQHNLLPHTHFGGLPGRSTTDSLHLLTKFVHDAWAHPTDNHVSMMFMDVKAAFPSVVPEQLFHNMRKRGIPTEYIEWYRTRLTGRSTTLEFDDYCSPFFQIESGVDQGCPLSPLAFLYYNADVLDIPNNNKNALVLGFIDDICLLARGPTFEDANDILKDMIKRPNGFKDWSTSHQVEWEVDKTALLQASRRRQKDPNNPRKTIPIKRVPITVSNRTITPSSSHKFLGVIIDEQLRFKEQIADAAAKGTRYAAACRRFAKPSTGIRLSHMRQLYTSVIVPKMLYAVDVWGAEMVARLGDKAGSRGLGRILERVLRTHALASTGAMCTTSTEVTVAHANIAPLPFLLQRLCFRSFARMSTLPSSNPIHREIRQAARLRKRHRSPLHHLAAVFTPHPKQVEEIKALRHSPKWSPLTSIVIDEDTEEAIKRAQEADEEVQIFTDGSGINNSIGAAAILRRQGQADKVLRFHLGSQTHYTVYNGEQIGMLLGAELLRREANVRSVYMGVDNQAAIAATVSRNCHSGHSLTDLFLQTLQTALRKHDLQSLSVRWVPGHTNIAGNEAVDVEAKKAAEGETSRTDLLPSVLRRKHAPVQLPYNKSALIQNHNTLVATKAKATFASSRRGTLMHKVDPSLPSAKFTRLVHHLPRRHASAIIQLRTGHAPLNHHLARIGKVPSSTCPNCDAATETVHHFLFMCPAYEAPRRNLRVKVGPQKMDFKGLLADENNTRYLLKFLAQTKRLAPTFGNLSPPERRQ